ncbi:MAG TPA: sialidase family protein [Chloroflexia bacterium]|nr:sialidase family protein [Chloroflexia bacterium]
MACNALTRPRREHLFILFLSLAAVCVFLMGGRAQAGVNIWTQMGPGGGSLEIRLEGWLVPGYRSTDNGKTWQRLGQVSQGPFYGPSSVGSAGKDGKTLLALLLPGPLTGGPGGHYMAPPSIFRSTDAGATWGADPVFTGLGGPTRFTAGGPDRQIVYAAIAPDYRQVSGGSEGQVYQAEFGSGLAKSTDAGATWRVLSVGIQTNNVLLDESDPNKVWAAGESGLARSTDAGATWTKVTTSPQVGGLIYGSPSRGILYAYGAGGFTRQQGVARGPFYKSDDGGSTWRPLSMGAGALPPAQYEVFDFAVESGNPNHVVVSWTHKQTGLRNIGESLDGGSTWRDLNMLGNDYSHYVAIDAQTGYILAYGDKLYAYEVVEEKSDPAFQRVWQRQDHPVQQGAAQRSWTWGPRPLGTMREALSGLPGDSRLVQYYDKSRMEVNDPNGDRASPWFVTNGLLTVEMVAGRVQTGLNAFEERAPSQLPVAGHPTRRLNPKAPSYASFQTVASYKEKENTVPSRAGSVISESLDAAGKVGSSVPPTQTLELAMYDAQTGHNIAAPFWEYLNRKGKVWVDGKYVEQPIYGDWVFVMGHPISEPYWSTMGVDSDAQHWVLIQLFERRVLTYTPDNTPEWRVEMGNVGLHYYVWRYGDPQP